MNAHSCLFSCRMDHNYMDNMPHPPNSTYDGITRGNTDYYMYLNPEGVVCRNENGGQTTVTDIYPPKPFNLHPGYMFKY